VSVALAREAQPAGSTVGGPADRASSQVGVRWSREVLSHRCGTSGVEADERNKHGCDCLLSVALARAGSVGGSAVGGPADRPSSQVGGRWSRGVLSHRCSTAGAEADSCTRPWCASWLSVAPAREAPPAGSTVGGPADWWSSQVGGRWPRGVLSHRRGTSGVEADERNKHWCACLLSVSLAREAQPAGSPVGGPADWWSSPIGVQWP
jgi:hypothetical protein